MKRVSEWFKKYFIPHEGNNFKPHFLRHETMISVFFLIIIIELGFLVQVFIVFDKTKFLASVLPGVLATLTNEERADNNVPPLRENPLLDEAAQDKANDMAANGYFAHTSPDGKTPWYWFQLVGYNYIYAGENLAVNFFDSSAVAQAWMNSPTHRANIVNPNYTDIGFGVASGVYQGHNTIFVAQLFGKPLIFPGVDENPEPPVTTPTPSPAIIPLTAPAISAVPTPTTVVSAPETAPVISSKSASKPAPVTQPATVTTPVAPIVSSAPAPIAVEVLGEESTAAVPASTTATVSPIKAFMERALSAPQVTVSYVYELLGLFILLALVIFFLVKTERQHKRIMAEGFALIAVILVLSYINIRVLNIKTQVPTDDNNITASVINAPPQ